MINRFSVRNIRPTPTSKVNKKNTNNKYYFDVYDKQKFKTERFFGATISELDDVRTEQKNKVKHNIYTVSNATIDDAAQIEIKLQEGKRDNGIIKDSTLRDYEHSWSAIKDIEYNGKKLKDIMVKEVNLQMLTSLSNKLLTCMGLRQNKNSWMRLGAILNVAAAENMGVPMFITKSVPRGSFTSAWKRREKYVPPILNFNGPERTMLIVNKALLIAKQATIFPKRHNPGKFYYVLLRTLLEGNIRISELIPLETRDYDVRMNAFLINKAIDIKTGLVSYTKSKESNNLVFVSEEFTKIYIEWLEELKNKTNNKQLIFPATNGNYKSYSIILKNIKKIFILAGWNEDISTHDFRSFGAVYRKYLKLDKTSQDHLRHSSRHMTKLYERDKDWNDAEKLIAASNEVAQHLE